MSGTRLFHNVRLELTDLEAISQLDTILGVRDPASRPIPCPATPSCPAEVDVANNRLTWNPEHLPARLRYLEKTSSLLFVEIHIPG